MENLRDLIRLVVTWTLPIWEINNLLIFERQILRKIFRSVKSKEGCRIRNNNKLQKLIKGEDITKYIKPQRIKQWGHLNRMENIKLVKKFTDWNPSGLRTKGWGKKTDEVVNDLKKLRLRNWNQITKNRKACNDLLQKTKTHVGM